VGDGTNTNFSGPQMELLLWHWRFGCSARRVQQLIVDYKGIRSNDESAIFPQVIKPKFKSTSSCPIPICVAGELVHKEAKFLCHKTSSHQRKGKYVSLRSVLDWGFCLNGSLCCEDP